MHPIIERLPTVLEKCPNSSREGVEWDCLYKTCQQKPDHHAHSIHVWYIYLHLPQIQVNIPLMDGIGCKTSCKTAHHVWCPILPVNAVNAACFFLSHVESVQIKLTCKTSTWYELKGRNLRVWHSLPRIARTAPKKVTFHSDPITLSEDDWGVQSPPQQSI